VTWADAVPNLLIGLREGLEGGLVVSILLAAVRKTTAPQAANRRAPTAPVWLGVLGAVTVAGSFAAVLTFSTSVLPSRAQDAAGGLLSALAVGLVTSMVFWMRRTAASLSAQLRWHVQRAAAIGAGALTITAFLAVGREGLETTLFLWTAVKASGQTISPLAGAALGLAAAVALCGLLYRRAVRLNVGVFFNRTAIALIVIAAGVLAYGLGDLQDAGLLSGRRWLAFDLTAHVDPNSWWASIVTGATELSPKMTVLQVVAWVVYLAVVIPLFVHTGRVAAAARSAATPPPAGSSSALATAEPAAAVSAAAVSAAAVSAAAVSAAAATGAPASAAPATGAEPGPARWERLAARRPWAVAAALVVAPTIAAGAAIAALPAPSASGATAVSVTSAGCAKDWTAASTGPQTFTVDNQSSKAGEVTLVNAAGAVVAEIETLGPATTADMAATLGPGSYTFTCRMSGQAVTTSPTVQVSGRTSAAAPAAVKPVSVQDLVGPNRKYEAYAAADLRALAGAVATIRTDLRGGNLSAARTDWLAAQLDWEKAGASYDSFGDDGLAVDGLPGGLVNGVNDRAFTGLHRLEYGLWHGQSTASLLPVASALARNVATVQKDLTSGDLAGDPTNLPIRAHEILEDALRDHLSGLDDQGSGTAFPETYADLQVSRVVLSELAPLIDARAPKLLVTAQAQMGTLQQALLATREHGRWTSPSAASLSARQHVDGAIGALLETLSSVPDLLEVPSGH
jgi:high-affinity iron transporter